MTFEHIAQNAFEDELQKLSYSIRDYARAGARLVFPSSRMNPFAAALALGGTGAATGSSIGKTLHYIKVDRYINAGKTPRERLIRETIVNKLDPVVQYHKTNKMISGGLIGGGSGVLSGLVGGGLIRHREKAVEQKLKKILFGTGVGAAALGTAGLVAANR